MSRYNKILGDFGESAAAEYLKRLGYTVLERNYNTRAGEIDIVACDNGILVFVEVKTRSSLKFGLPSEAVDYKKKEHLSSAAEIYLNEHPADADVRFDVIEAEAVMENGEPRLISINHIIDALVF